MQSHLRLARGVPFGLGSVALVRSMLARCFRPYRHRRGANLYGAARVISGRALYGLDWKRGSKIALFTDCIRTTTVTAATIPRTIRPRSRTVGRDSVRQNQNVAASTKRPMNNQ